jgi:putative membrane protein
MCPWCNHGWWGGGMMLFWTVLVLAIVWVIWTATRGRTSGTGDRRGDAAEDILRARYARGEIDDETYRRMLAELRRGQ